METRAGPLLQETATRARRQFCGRRVEGSSRPGDDTGPTPAIGVGLSACEGDAVRGDVATSNRRGVVVLPGGSKGDDSASDGAGRHGVYDAQHRGDGPRERSSGTSHDQRRGVRTRATRTTAVRRISGLRGRSSGTGGATRHRPRRGLRVGPPRPAAIYPGGARLLRSGLEVG